MQWLCWFLEHEWLQVKGGLKPCTLTDSDSSNTPLVHWAPELLAPSVKMEGELEKRLFNPTLKQCGKPSINQSKWSMFVFILYFFKIHLSFVDTQSYTFIHDLESTVNIRWFPQSFINTGENIHKLSDTKMRWLSLISQWPLKKKNSYLPENACIQC